MTKKCKSCQSDIDVKAKKCPRCGSDQRNWLARHPIITGIIILIVVFGVIGAVSSSNSPQKVGQTTTHQVNQTNGQATTAPQTQTYKIGDQVNLQGKTLTVNGVAPYTSGNQFMQPKNGNKFVSVDVSLRNDSKDPFEYNVLELKLHDNKDYEYSNAATDQEPYLTTGTVQPGQTTRGFIDYEIPADNTPAKMIYTPGFLNLQQIIIDLTK